MKTEALVEQLLDLKIVVNLSRWKTKLDTIGTERNYYLSSTDVVVKRVFSITPASRPLELALTTAYETGNLSTTADATKR